MTNDLVEYIVILKSDENIDDFYDDMESPGGTLYIPNRAVDLANRRPTSRSTHYYLTQEEANTLKQDPRVLDVIKPYYDVGIEITPFTNGGIQYSNSWGKRSTPNSNDVNWGLLRCFETDRRSTWGSDNVQTASGNINLTLTGNNVDVVIIDGHMLRNHPEWASNIDGTGPTRFQEYNWFDLNPFVRGTVQGSYTYDYDSKYVLNNNHGNNVGSITAGSLNGWAKQANIYNINSLGQTVNSYSTYVYDVINYVRWWHLTKPLNPSTGRQNPTICNLSYGSTISIFPDTIAAVQFQTTTYNKPPASTGSTWIDANRSKWGIVAKNAQGKLVLNVRDASIDNDIADAINDGIIMVGAAGNNFSYIDVPTGPDYYNYVQLNNGQKIYYHQGPSPGAASGMICVSSIDDTAQERKANYSNAGPRTTIFAPGTSIQGAGLTYGVSDPRNSGFNVYKGTGTSQASPQVCGVLACMLERWPTMRQTDAINWLLATANYNKIVSGYTSGVPIWNTSLYNEDDMFLLYNSLLGASNRLLKYVQYRPYIGQVFPNKLHNIRPTTARTWPRHSIKRYG